MGELTDLDMLAPEECQADGTTVATLDFTRFLQQLTEHYFNLPRELMPYSVLHVKVVPGEAGGNTLDVHVTVPPELLPEATPDLSVADGENTLAVS